MNNNRLLDKFLLSDVRNTARSVEILSRVEGPVSAEIEMTFTRTHELIDKSPTGLAKAFGMDLTLAVVATPGDDKSEGLFNGSVRMRAEFVSADDTEISEEMLRDQIHSFSRLVYPLARLELFRLLAGAKLQDRSLPWDLGFMEPPSA